MSKRITYLFVSGIFLLILSLSPVALSAQTDPPPPADCNAADPDATPCPVDGGLSILLIAGIAYGAKKIKYTGFKKPVQMI